MPFLSNATAGPIPGWAEHPETVQKHAPLPGDSYQAAHVRSLPVP
jgi:hypothetical protein